LSQVLGEGKLMSATKICWFGVKGRLVIFKARYVV